MFPTLARVSEHLYVHYLPPCQKSWIYLQNWAGKIDFAVFFILIFAKYTILHFLFQMVVDGCHFRIVFPGYGYGYGYVKQLELITGEFIPIVKNAIKWKYCALTRKQKCAFLCILTLSIPDGCLWVSFSDSFSWGIHSNRQKCNRVQKLRPHAHFARQKCAFLCILRLSIPDGCWWLSFSESFSWGIHSNSKKCNRVKILCPHTHIASQKCAFLWILTLSIPDGWWWVSFSDSFSCGIHSNSKKCNQVQKLRPLAQKMRISMHTYTFYSRWLLMAVDVSFSIVFPGELISDFTFAHFSFSRNFDFVKFISPTCFVSQLIAFLYGLIYPLTRFMPKIMKFCRKLRGTGVMAFFISKIELGLLILLSVILVFQYSFFFKNLFLIIASMYRLICPFSEQSHFHYLPAWQKSFNLSQKLSWDYWNYF